MRKITWRVGRPGICEDGKAVVQTFKICPGIKELLAEYCTKNKTLSSIVVNQAIKEYILKQLKEQE